MATVRLSDAIEPTVFSGYITKDTMQKSAFYGSGALRSDPDLAAKLAGGGRTFNVPFWKDLDDSEPDAASDDPDSHAVPSKLTSGTDIARRIIWTKGWSTANLVQELIDSDPMARIGSRVGDYWARRFDDAAIAVLRGIFADNILNDSGDMVEDIALNGAGTVGAANRISAEAVMDAAQTMGDAKSALRLLVIHSEVGTRLAKNDLIDFVPDSSGNLTVPTYLGYRVYESDKVPALSDGNGHINYWNFLIGNDAFGWAESPVARPVEVESDPSAGDGMGVETLWTRRQFAMHPYGIKWTDASVGGEFPTVAELRLAANWDRVYSERKQIPLALLITNG
jgi:hypothetical protein